MHGNLVMIMCSDAEGEETMVERSDRGPCWIAIYKGLPIGHSLPYILYNLYILI